MMEAGLAILVGVLVASATFLLLRRNLLRQVFGIMLLSAGINLLILSVGRLTRVTPPLVPDAAVTPPEGYANPLSQALILTAIVISFGLTVFTLVLLYRVFQELGTVDADDLGEFEDECYVPASDDTSKKASKPTG
jgi:multicomponent Na+:H+ antiporter subunit C